VYPGPLHLRHVHGSILGIRAEELIKKRTARALYLFHGSSGWFADKVNRRDASEVCSVDPDTDAHTEVQWPSHTSFTVEFVPALSL
jgi:hypothetical protein